MKKINNLLIMILLIIITVSCVDESKNPLADFGASQGAFIRFTNEVSPSTLSYADPSQAGFSLPIEDLNGNTKNYKLSLTAIISGTQFVVEDIIEITSFPATLEINAQLIADSLGITLDDMGFGDNFAFTAKATRNDDVVFYGTAPNIDSTTNLYNGGNTSNNLLTLPGYRNAMNFNFTFSCPSFPIEDLVGMYNVLSNGLAPGLGLVDPNPTREIILGPGENQITIIGGQVGFAGGDDLILDVDVNAGVANLGLDLNGNPGLAFPIGTAGLSFGSDYGELDSGSLILTCLDSPILLDLNMTLTCCAFPTSFVLEKQ